MNIFPVCLRYGNQTLLDPIFNFSFTLFSIFRVFETIGTIVIEGSYLNKDIVFVFAEF